MGTEFEQRVRSAGVAGWWTLLIAAVVLVIQWLAYLSVMSLRPEWVRWLWGPGISWEQLGRAWWVGTAVLKFVLLVLALACVWLTLWARQLRKS